MWVSMRRFLNIWHPQRYHDPGSRRPYFEGWYFKMISADRKHALAVIPGVFLDGKGGDHSFIQILDGTHQTSYYRFPYEAFQAEQGRFQIRIEENRFSLDQIILNLNSQGGKKIAGELRFEELTPWPVRLFSPGVMGWYAFVPTMECYHGVLSMGHTVEGSLLVEGDEIDFSGGQGYMEKDWGVSFPLAYVWMQCNHFHRQNISLMVSIARIPWKKSAFRGFLIGFLKDSTLYRMTTYTGAHIDGFSVSENEVHIEAHDRHIRLEITARRSAGGTLYGPDGTQMHQHVSESLCSETSIKVWEENQILFEGKGAPAALEVHGDMGELS
jgi:tocopherol cyclase